MRVFVDCEFNGFGGDLISMALVSEKGDEWYEVCWMPKAFESDVWVWENVLPLLDKPAIGLHEFAQSFGKFVTKLNPSIVVADWPADLKHFYDMMCGSSHQDVVRVSVGAELFLKADYVSPRPHNALADARALRDHYMQVTA